MQQYQIHSSLAIVVGPMVLREEDLSWLGQGGDYDFGFAHSEGEASQAALLP